MSLLGPSLQQAAERLQGLMEDQAARETQVLPPVPMWQGFGESDAAFDARVAIARGCLEARCLLLAVCGPGPRPAQQGVKWVELPPKLLALLNPGRKSRYRVAYGGRGSAKSWNFARALVVRALGTSLRVLCGRELQGSIQESVLRLLADQIELLGLSPWFDVQAQGIYGHAGSEFIFSGIRNNVSKVKSTEGIDICWIEEAEKISDYSWSVVIPTVRKSGSEIWASFNPDQEDDPTYVRFAKTPPPGALIDFVNWTDNPWFPQELEAEREYLARVDPDAHAWIWGGNCRAASDAQIFRGKFVVEAFEAAKGWAGPYQGADWGFAVDPSTLVRCWVHERVLYIEHEAYAVGVDIDKTAALFDRVPGARDFTTRADNARPETISYMQQHGYHRVVAVQKWPGSVEDGIAHIRQFERIVIHPRCVHAVEEFRLYSYKVDKLTGDVLPEVLSGHDHIVDALRYALQPLIRAGNSGFLTYMQLAVAEMRDRQRAEGEIIQGELK